MVKKGVELIITLIVVSSTPLFLLKWWRSQEENEREWITNLNTKWTMEVGGKRNENKWDFISDLLSLWFGLISVFCLCVCFLSSQGFGNQCRIGMFGEIWSGMTAEVGHDVTEHDYSMIVYDFVSKVLTVNSESCSLFFTRIKYNTIPSTPLCPLCDLKPTHVRSLILHLQISDPHRPVSLTCVSHGLNPPFETLMCVFRGALEDKVVSVIIIFSPNQSQICYLVSFIVIKPTGKNHILSPHSDHIPLYTKFLCPSHCTDVRVLALWPWRENRIRCKYRSEQDLKTDQKTFISQIKSK